MAASGDEHRLSLDEPQKQSLLNRHTEKHFTAGEIVRDIIIGVSDGLTVPFALAAGLSGANATSSIVLTAGIAEVAAGAISMGLGGYLSSKSSILNFDLKIWIVTNFYWICDFFCSYLAAKGEADHYNRELKREQDEIIAVPETGSHYTPKQNFIFQFRFIEYLNFIYLIN